MSESIRIIGIKTIYANKGDKNLEAAMWRDDYMLGGEIGGNILINDGYHTAADAIYTALVLAGILMKNRNDNLGQIVSQMRKNPQEILSFKMTAKPSAVLNEELQKHIQDLAYQLGSGSRIMFWESSTERQIFRVLIEGGAESGKEHVSKIAQLVRQIIEQAIKMHN